MTRHIVSVGDLVLDIIMPVRLPIQPFEHQAISALELQPGGSGSFMIMARRLGLRVSAVGALGADMFGSHLRAALESEGVEMQLVAAPPGSRTTLVYVLIDLERREHTFIGYSAAGQPLSWSPQLDELVAAGDAIFMQAYNLIEPQLTGIIDPILKRGRAAKIPIFFDVGPTAKFCPSDRLIEVLAQVDYIMMTEDEVPLAARGLEGDAAYAYLLDLGATALIVKQGAAGCAIIERDQRQRVPGFPARVVDTVGAGDCFNAAFIFGFVQGCDLRRCAVIANAAGAAAVQKLGAGLNVPTRAEVRAVLGDQAEELLP